MHALYKPFRAIAIPVLGFLGLSLVSCTATIPMKTRALPGKPVAVFPEMVVGDSWLKDTHQGKRYYKIIDINSDGSFVTELKDGRGKFIWHLHYDNNYRLKKRENIITGELSEIPTPPQNLLKFPLIVGKKWEDQFYGKALDRQSYEYKNSYTVKKVELINTKAGRFEAFKIFRVQKILGSPKSLSLYETYWYAPEVKAIIKSKPSWKKGIELQSYELAKIDTAKPVIVINAPTVNNGKAQARNSDEEISGYINDDNKVVWFKVNNKKLTLNESGMFSFRPQLSQGENEFKFQAKDAFGNVASKRVKITYEAPVISGNTNFSHEPSTDVMTSTEARWAVVIGISEYQDSRIPSLRYAASDALAFYQWLISADGGRYAPARIKLLVNDQATGENIKSALFTYLAQALEEDVVTLYFAGHGSPQSPDNPENLFLLPHDANYVDLAATGFPMWDVETAFRRFIKAKKVVVIADACHAGGVGKSFDVARRTNRGIPINTVSSGLQDLPKIGDGVCIISASADNQFSQESRQWGGGHGVFTYYLVEGLKGKADYNNDSRVSLGEIIPYISEQVRRATRNAQTPTVAGRFDPALSIGKYRK